MILRYLLVAALSLPCLWLSTLSAYVNISANNAGSAIGIWPANGFAYSSAAEAILRDETRSNNKELPSRLNPRIGILAGKAFRLEPMDEKAVRQLALIAAQQNGKAAARRVMLLASQMGRRDLVTNMWLVEDYGRAENLPKALQHLDYALRTSSESQGILMSALVQAMANREMVPQMRKLLASDPSWRSAFWFGITEAKGPLQNALELRLAMVGEDVDIPEDSDRRLLENLVRIGSYADAFRLYRNVLLPRENPSKAVQHVGFNRPALWPPLDWRVASEGAYSAWLNPDRSELEVSLLGQTDAVFAERLIELVPGTYRLSGRIAEDDQELSKALSLSLECAESDAPKNWNIEVAFERGAAAKVVQLEDGGCRYFWLKVRGSPARDSLGYDATFKAVTVTKLGR